MKARSKRKNESNVDIQGNTTPLARTTNRKSPGTKQEQLTQKQRGAGIKKQSDHELLLSLVILEVLLSLHKDRRRVNESRAACSSSTVNKTELNDDDVDDENAAAGG